MALFEWIAGWYNPPRDTLPWAIDLRQLRGEANRSVVDQNTGGLLPALLNRPGGVRWQGGKAKTKPETKN